MKESPSHVVSAVEAARRIYNTPSPTAEQIGRIVQKMQSGALKRSPKGGPTTTLEAIAEYMARCEADRGHTGGSAHLKTNERATLDVFYRDLLSDYFLALLMRRRVGHRSAAFRASVVATQAALLLAIIVLLGSVTANTLRTQMIPADHRAARAWLQEHYPNSEIRELHSFAEPAPSVRVKFRYQVNGRQIYSDLILTLQGNRVTRVSSGD